MYAKHVVCMRQQSELLKWIQKKNSLFPGNWSAIGSGADAHRHFTMVLRSSVLERRGASRDGKRRRAHFTSPAARFVDPSEHADFTAFHTRVSNLRSFPLDNLSRCEV